MPAHESARVRSHPPRTRAHAQVIPFEEGLYPEGNVENWLGDVEQMMYKSVKKSVRGWLALWRLAHNMSHGTRRATQHSDFISTRQFHRCPCHTTAAPYHAARSTPPPRLPPNLQPGAVRLRCATRSKTTSHAATGRSGC